MYFSESNFASKLDKIFEEVVKIRVLLEVHLEKELECVAVPVADGDDHPLNFTFPAKSKDCLEDLEYRIKSEPSFKKQLVIHFHKYYSIIYTYKYKICFH